MIVGSGPAVPTAASMPKGPPATKEKQTMATPTHVRERAGAAAESADGSSGDAASSSAASAGA